MKYIVSISPDAIRDIQEAVDYYNDQKKGLGKRCAIVKKATISKIRKMPFAASIPYDDSRYKVLGKFPYVVLYKIRRGIIFIMRVYNT